MPDIIILSIFSLIQSAVIHWLIKKWYKEKKSNRDKIYSANEAHALAWDQYRKDNEFHFRKLASVIQHVKEWAEDPEFSREDLVIGLKKLEETAEEQLAIHEFNSIAKTHVQTEGK